MSDNQHKLQLSFYVIFILAALVIIVDFVFPGKVITDEIINVKKEQQQYYNAARNYHYSYKLITSEYQFPVTEEFAELIQDEEKIQFSVSRIFKEVNWYRLLSSDNRDTYSLRIFSGLVLPLLTIISILVDYLYKKNLDILVFVLQVLLIGDLIFLMI